MSPPTTTTSGTTTTTSPPKFTPAATLLRAQLATTPTTGPLLCPGVYDGLTARLALSLGFQTLYMTGAGTSASRLGSPDLALLTLPEMATNATMIASLDTTVPVIADADTGFGGPLSVARTVRAYIDGNVAALHLEDQSVSKRCGHLAGKELVSLDVFETRIRAAVLARQESGRDIVLIARTDALQSLGFDEAVRRLKAAVAIGADVAFLEGVASAEQGRQVCEAMAPTPCLLNVVAGGVSPNFSAKEARSMGFGIVIWPMVGVTAVFRAVGEAMGELRDTGKLEVREGGGGGLRIFLAFVDLRGLWLLIKGVGGRRLGRGSWCECPELLFG